MTKSGHMTLQVILILFMIIYETFIVYLLKL